MILIEACVLGLGILLVAACVINTVVDIVNHYTKGTR